MTLKELKAFCKSGEGQYLEFKQNANHPEQVLEEVVGFANSTGGNLLVGIADNGNTTGLKFAEGDVEFLNEQIRINITPSVPYSFDIISINKSKSVIKFNIKSGSEKPYGLRKGNSKKVFYRVNDLCIQASRELKNILRSTTHSNGQTIKYTELENKILKIIEHGIRLTKNQITKKAEFSSRRVSECLVRLVSAGILKIIPAVDNDLYEYHKQS
jgi:predicted HTH transcriptional regulator